MPETVTTPLDENISLVRAIQVLDELVYRYCDLNDQPYPNKWNDAMIRIKKELQR